MSKAKKICFIIFCILILTIFLPILIDYHQVSDLGIQLTSWRQTSFEYYLARYVFWGLLGLSILVLLWVLVILFYPRQYLEIKLGTKEDKLKLKNSAIEGFVRCLVLDHKLVKEPKIKVQTWKKKCFVSVEGTTVLSDNIANKFEVVQNEITQGLKEFFGIDREVKLEVSVKEYDPQKAAKKIVSRVK